MEDKPTLRPIEAFPVQQAGKTLIYLKDPLSLATPIGISPAGYFVLSYFDGRHSFVDIQEAFSKQFNSVLLSDELQSFVEMLDQHYYLQSERFERHQSTIVEEFRGLTTRTAAHVGAVYKEDPVELATQLEGYFTGTHGPGLPEGHLGASTPKAIVAPHIDFHRGGPAYAWAYRPLIEAEGADLYILLGTSHYSGRTPYILTLKDFETPLGLVETYRDFVQQLQANCAEDCFADEYLHRGEHSLEFQVVFLKYVAQKRAALAGRREKPFKIVPILVSSFQAAVVSQTPPESSPAVEVFLNSLRELAGKDSREVCLVAGVDLAHVGRQFGDAEPITDDFLKWVENEDQELIDRLAGLDARGFFHAVAKDQDKRRICGFSPLYSLIQVLDGVKGKPLKYSQAFTPETGSAVTFTSVVFE
jgi:hypothetical protein